MAAVFEEVTITWDGEEHVVTPTYKMVNQIEQRVSLVALANRIANGEPPVSHMAEVLAVLLRNAGVQVSPDDVYAELMNTEDPEAFTQIAHVILTAFVPSKKSDSPAAGAKKKTAAKKATTKKK